MGTSPSRCPLGTEPAKQGETPAKKAREHPAVGAAYALSSRSRAKHSAKEAGKTRLCGQGRDERRTARAPIRLFFCHRSATVAAGKRLRQPRQPPDSGRRSRRLWKACGELRRRLRYDVVSVVTVAGYCFEAQALSRGPTRSWEHSFPPSSWARRVLHMACAGVGSAAARSARGSATQKRCCDPLRPDSALSWSPPRRSPEARAQLTLVIGMTGCRSES